MAKSPRLRLWQRRVAAVQRRSPRGGWPPVRGPGMPEARSADSVNGCSSIISSNSGMAARLSTGPTQKSDAAHAIQRRLSWLGSGGPRISGDGLGTRALVRQSRCWMSRNGSAVLGPASNTAGCGKAAARGLRGEVSAVHAWPPPGSASHRVAGRGPPAAFGRAGFGGQGLHSAPGRCGRARARSATATGAPLASAGGAARLRERETYPVGGVRVHSLLGAPNTPGPCIRKMVHMITIQVGHNRQ